MGRQFVRTDRGSGWVNRTEPLVGSGLIFISLCTVKLMLEGRITELPPGTAFVRSHRLSRQTAGKPREERRTHMIVEEGLHRLERLCYHVTSTERHDHTVMVHRREQIAVIAKELLACGQMTFEEHEKLTVALAVVRTSFDELKTNEHKQTVRKRIDTASAQRSRSGRFKPAPAALTTFASTPHIRKRLVEISGIHAAFSAHALEMGAQLEEVKSFTSSVWIECMTNGPTERAIARAMDRLKRDKVTIKIAHTHLQAVRANLTEIRAQPYWPLAQAALGVVDDLERAINGCRRKEADTSLDRLCYLLRRMRMVWYIERSLIHILSFLPDDGEVPKALMDRFRDRLTKAEARVANMSDEEFDPELRMLVKEYLEATRTNVKNGDYDKAHEELGHLTSQLRVLPVHPARRKAA